MKKGTDVLLQAFTCNAVPNPILWANLNPVYIDCNDDFNIDTEKLSIRLASLVQDKTKTSVLVLQHTFGLPANMDEIMALARDKNLTVIEDCAHALGAEFNARKIGTFGKAAFFSFSRDKVISSVYGGMVVTNYDEIGKKLEELQKEFGMPSYYWIFQQVLHPILLNFVILPIYNFLDLGKIFLILSQWLHILSKAVHWKEKRGLKPDYFPKALPNALALMAQNQFNKLEKFNKHRQEISEFYYNKLKDTKFTLPTRENNIFLRFAIKHPKAHEIIYEAWHKKNILLGDWYTTPIAPDDTKLDQMHYKIGSCPNSEKLSRETLNLPTHINISLQPRSGQAISDAQRIVNFLKQWR